MDKDNWLAKKKAAYKIIMSLWFIYHFYLIILLEQELDNVLTFYADVTLLIIACGVTLLETHVSVHISVNIVIVSPQIRLQSTSLGAWGDFSFLPHNCAPKGCESSYSSLI